MDNHIDAKAVERRVMADHDRPCLYGVTGPCFHPKCLESHYNTLYAEAQARRSQASGSGDA